MEIIRKKLECIRLYISYIYHIGKGDIEMVEYLAARVSWGYLTAMPGKETPTRRLVPERLRPAVIKALLEMGLDADGAPITENNTQA